MTVSNTGTDDFLQDGIDSKTISYYVEQFWTSIIL